MNYSLKFPVVKGVQAKKEYYIAMVPLRMLTRLFPEDEYVLPEYRAQRRLNESRIPQIKKYIIENMDSYVFSALAASIDGNFTYIPGEQEDTGILEVDMDAKFLINDGQHRKAAIQAALEENEELGTETISVVFYEDRGLSRSQQMFTDLNKHAVKTSNSIAELYDSRDELAVITREVISRVPFLNEYVDKEKDNLGKFSSSLFTLNTIYNTNKKMLSRNSCEQRFKGFLLSFWEAVVEYMPPWREFRAKEISKRELREKYIATQAVILYALGRVGSFLYDNPEFKIESYIPKITEIDWKRNADDWLLRVIRSNGRILNNADAILLANNYIKKKIGLPLCKEEKAAEEKFLNTMKRS
ncbi:DNA sulfur modification protein DndB [Ohessyouella blattaphilus]|uniref:DNA sulfur modification protein DndB n=1 Tax=Ohessyouella blattaphilus TaxID=2949333 RepID=A0ABT1EJK7_9FIRM|nr:DNA sulfur modification protein DndB [Ohessyouella blattaphilus]MCP1110889.1 DNA sulfur modification protein DndB [Ohessyouella blattaphilus]MCR8564283.1 DNA sulfur modification protein DndB [Ohessyouella blattaphilus]